MAEEDIFHDIERGVKALLVGANLPIEEFDIGYYPENLRDFAANVSVVDGRTEMQTMKSVKQTAKIRIVLVLKDLRDKGDETNRRERSLPVVYSVIKLLLLKDLGLVIKPIVPSGFRYKTSNDNYKSGFIVWELNFETNFNIEPIDPDADALDLNEIFVQYFLQPDDENADASDLVTLEQ